jgi:hypothetical protein
MADWEKSHCKDRRRFFVTRNGKSKKKNDGNISIARSDSQAAAAASETAVPNEGYFKPAGSQEQLSRGCCLYRTSSTMDQYDPFRFVTLGISLVVNFALSPYIYGERR